MNSTSPLTPRVVDNSVRTPDGPGDSIRVVHCIPTLALGGAQRVMIELIRQMERRGITSHLVVLGGKETAVEWPTLPIEPRFLNYRGSLRDHRGRKRAVHELSQLFHSEQISLIHSHLWGAASVSGSAASQCGIPHVVHVHDTRPWVRSASLRDRFRRWRTRRELTGARTFCVAVSSDAWKYNCGPLGLDDADYRVIPNGVNSVEFHPQDEATARRAAGELTRIGVVARFNPEKGHEVLIRAFTQLIEEGKVLELHLAGDGTLLDDCRLLASELGVGEFVKFAGMTTDIPGFLHSLDLFVLPSLGCEGMPLSILEAMAVGLPVVATDVGGTREIVEDGVTGLLIRPGDVDALAAAIRSLVDDHQQRQRLSMQAQELIARRHSWEVVADELEGIYQLLVGLEGQCLSSRS